jgi:hypothetical protein
MDVNPIELQKHLKGAGYPASRDDLVSLARDNGAPEDIVNALENAETDTFDGPDDVQRALS